MAPRRRGPESRRFEELVKGPFAFLWSVPEGGYRWETGAEPVDKAGADWTTGPWLIPPAPIGESYPAGQYPPLEIPGLHRRFARLRPSPEAVLRFANRYGDLGRGVPLIRVPPPEGGQPILTGEPFGMWRAEILRLSHLLDIWDLARRRQEGKLGEHVIWQRAPLAVRLEWESPAGASYRSTIATERDRDLLSRDGWGFGQVVEPACYYVHKAVNDSLRGRASPLVLPFRRGEIYLFPHDLLAAIYVHFALELSGRTPPAKTCQGCGRFFDPIRSDQRYCEPACRKKRWYHDSPGSQKNRGKAKEEGNGQTR